MVAKTKTIYNIDFDITYFTANQIDLLSYLCKDVYYEEMRRQAGESNDFRKRNFAIATLMPIQERLELLKEQMKPRLYNEVKRMVKNERQSIINCVH